MDETERQIVAWLRDLAEDCPPFIDKFIRLAADGIERGEHRESDDA